MASLAPKKRRMKSRNQRCALPACGDVATAEVRDHRDLRALGDPRGIVELQRPSPLRPMAQRLSMNTDGDHLVAIDLRIGERAPNRIGVELGEHVCSRAGARQLVRTGGLQRQQFVAQHRR